MLKRTGARSAAAAVKRAFTLIELLVVLAVISILAGALLPEFAGTYQTMQLRSAAGTLADMVAFCSNSSAAEQANYRLYVEPESGRAWIEHEVTDEETGETQYEVAQFPGMRSYTLPETIRFDEADVESYLNADEDGTYYIQFRRDGISDFSALTLVPYRGNPMQITLNGLTGRVKTVELAPEDLQETAPAE